MSLTWMNNGFICKDLYAPFVLEKDSDYLDDLRKKYKIVLQQAGAAGADDESLKILKKFKKNIGSLKMLLYGGHREVQYNHKKSY